MVGKKSKNENLGTNNSIQLIDPLSSSSQVVSGVAI
jgi:hypothetical protein